MQLEVATSSGWRIQEQTQRERAFTRRLNKLINQADKLDDREVRKMMSMLRRTRERVAAAILDAEGFDMLHFARIEAAINTAFEELSAQYIAQSNGYLDNAWRFGAKMVDEPLDVAGLGMQLTAVPQVSIKQLEILQGFSADLIGGLLDDARGKINREIQLGIMGEQTPHQVMQGVGKNLTDPSTFRTIKARAEAITRTELNRVVNLGAQRRLKQVSEQIPEMKKYWMANIDGRERQAHGAVARRTNPNLGGVPIGVDEDFIVGGERAQGPYDPRLSAGQSIQCRCRLGYVLPEMEGESKTGEQVGRRRKPKRKQGEVAQIVKNAEDGIREQRYESCRVFDKDGNIILSKDGTQNEISFTDSEMARMKGMESFTHNHPGGWEFAETDPRHLGGAFSPEDLRLACDTELKEMRAVSPGYRHSIKPPRNGWNSEYWENTLYPLYQEEYNQLYKRNMKAINAGTMTIPEAEADHSHIVWESVAKQLGLFYSREKI